jgi:hypothetical protein
VRSDDDLTRADCVAAFADARTSVGQALEAPDPGSSEERAQQLRLGLGGDDLDDGELVRRSTPSDQASCTS